MQNEFEQLDEQEIESEDPVYNTDYDYFLVKSIYSLERFEPNY